MTPPGWRLEVYATLPSTSDAAIARAEAGEAAGLAILAHRQTRARGSRGREWIEPPAGNLALSVLLRPAAPAAAIQQAVFRAGLALIEAMDPFASAGALTLKWPNDVLLYGRKLAGILVESAAFDGRPAWLVIGFGANLAERPALLPGRGEAACLAEDGGRVVAPVTLADRLLASLDRWMADAFADVRAAWIARAHPVGSPLIVDGVAGEFAGLTASGALLFDDRSGRREVMTGEVFAPVLEAAVRHPT